ncbi:aprataxin and PNK-like factor [Rhinoderma darwinii]|uniref:aprataxin and PNK-like factor n=1 Tax=Rhinoderma darwinii TaxID=43563 RepID=UPI003F67CD6D
MSDYHLESTDGNGSLPIPVGETVLGRGPLLGIADKRVSRSHAVLDVVDDKLRIKAIHVNPCFYQASNKSTFVPLERNEWCWLSSGDCISLLPDKHYFRVIIRNPSEATLRNSEGLDEENELKDDFPFSAKTPETKAKSPLQYEPSSLPSTSNTRTNGKIWNDVPSAGNSKDDVEVEKPGQRKRVLPAWMMQGDLPVQTLPSHVITAVKKKRTIKPRIQTTSSLKSKDEDNSMQKQSEVLFPTTTSDLKRTATPINSQKGHVVDNEEEMEEEPCDDTPNLSTPPPSYSSPSGSPSTTNNKPSVSKAVENISLSPASPQNTQQTQKKRILCMYGDGCYRKNPVHFQEFCHPGDADYRDVEDGSQDDNDDRLECPYGTDCYRKNPQHKLEYKHTRPPGRKLRKRSPKKGKKSVLDGDSDNDGEPNDYDLDDSFIDDDEDFDITDEDSDWMPDSQDKDSEDVKDLLKEAKQFVKRKR